MAKLDQLKKEVDDFKKSLIELKNNISISEIERKTKLETLKTQAETTKQRLQREIATLSDKADTYSKKEKEKAKALLNSINESLTLYTSILN
jgi:t-SNARE complex subunit (syntaxin)